MLSQSLTKNMPNRAIHKTLWVLALPIMLSNISLPLLGLVDTAILGHLSDSRYLAAVAMGASLFMFVFWSFAFLRMGTTALIAQNLGSQNLAAQNNGHHESVHSIMHSAIFLAVLIGLSLIAVSPYLIDLMIGLVGAVEEIEPFATQYLNIRFYFAPITLLNYVFLGYFIGQGKTKNPLILLVSSNLLNGFLDYIFVYEFELNSAGVAYASNAAETFQLCLAIYFAKDIFVQSIDLEKLKTNFIGFLSLNFQLFIRTFFLLFTFAFFMSKGAQHSAALLSANAILFNLLMFISNGLDGFALASESMVGKAVGEKNIKRIKMVVLASGFWTFIFALCFSLFLMVAHNGLLNLLTSQQDVLDLLDQLTYWLIFLPLAGFACYWLDGIYIGLAAAKEMRNSILFALFILFLPLQALLQDWPLHGLWLAFFAFLLGRALWQLIYLPVVLKKVANSTTK